MTQEALIETLRELKRVGTESLPLNEIERGYNLAVEDCIREVMRYPTPDSEHALSLLRSVCTPLDHNLEIQPGCATHRCIQAFLGGERRSEDRDAQALRFRRALEEICDGKGYGHEGARQLAFQALEDAPSEIRDNCPSCGGNDTSIPCAYPSEGMPGCPRDKRLAEGGAFTAERLEQIAATQQPDDCRAAVEERSVMELGNVDQIAYSTAETFLNSDLALGSGGILRQKYLKIYEGARTTPERESGAVPTVEQIDGDESAWINAQGTRQVASDPLAEERLVQNLAALIRRMAYRMCRPHLPGNGKIAKEAMDFLAKYGLQGSCLRSEDDRRKS